MRVKPMLIGLTIDLNNYTLVISPAKNNVKFNTLAFVPKLPSLPITGKKFDGKRKGE